MARIHLFEFEDQKWFPRFLRNYGTDFLQFLANTTNMYKPVVPILEEILAGTQNTNIVDLGSGGGGGWICLVNELKAKVPGLKVTLTDIYPNMDAFTYTSKKSDRIDFQETPVDAMDVPEKLRGIRTQFLSLHHFRPKEARKILQNAVDSNSPVAIFEGQERSIPGFMAMFFSPITVLLTTPFIRPFKVGRIFFTYIIPLVPLFVWWDGMVSSLRTYSVKEMQELIDGLKNKDQFTWKTGRLRSGPGVILYLAGIPNTIAR